MKVLKQYIIMLAIAISATYANAVEVPEYETYNYKVTRVIDGDTIEFEARFLPDPLDKVLKLRIWGVDTPEKGWRAQCEYEAELGDQATAFAVEFIGTGRNVKVALMDWDKYGGRILGDIIVGGRSLREQLILNGLAFEYYGGTKQSWCEPTGGTN